MLSETPTSNPPKYLQVNLNQECENLILTLPKHKGWAVSHLYQYEGFWYIPRHLQGVLSCQKNFQQVQESDIFLVTAPKSGTTWLKALIFATMNRTQFPITSTDHPLITKNPHDLVPFLEINLYVDKENPDLSSLSAPRIFASHIPYESLPEPVKKSRTSKIVYLCRDPKDVFVSSWHFVNRLKPQESEEKQIEELFDTFCQGVSLFGPLWDHMLGYWNKSKGNDDGPEVLFLKYEDVKGWPGECLRRVAKFLNCPFSEDEERSGLVEEIVKMCCFDNLSNLETNKNGKLLSGEENTAYFRRGEVGDWKNYLSVEMVERFDQIIEEKLSGSGLIF